MGRVLVVAEAGVNHNGNIALARKMIDTAVEAEADCVKFQTAVPELVMTDTAPKAEYQKRATDAQESQIEMVRRIVLPLDAFDELKAYCEQRRIEFMSTPFDLVSVDKLVSLKVSCFKIPSGEITNLPYLRKVGGLRTKVLLSTGMASLGEIETALKVLELAGTSKENITVLHCTTEYPALFSDVNLRAMVTIKEAFHVAVGYSDHTPGIEVSLAAVALGATVIEKHFTLDKHMEGPDHKASLSPEELRSLVRGIRNVEVALGDGIKKPSSIELQNRDVVRRSIVAGRTIQKGEAFTPNNLVAKRPGTGLSPMMWDILMRRKAERIYQRDEMIEL